MERLPCFGSVVEKLHLPTRDRRSILHIENTLSRRDYYSLVAKGCLLEKEDKVRFYQGMGNIDYLSAPLIGLPLKKEYGNIIALDSTKCTDCPVQKQCASYEPIIKAK